MLRTFVLSHLILWVAQGLPTSSENLRKEQSSSALRNDKSKRILKYMNESADPCVSFFDFACGNWKTHHPANKSVQLTKSLDMAFEEFDRKMYQLLNTEDDRDTEAILKVKSYYQTCLSFTCLKPPDYREKFKEIIQEFGQMPALEGDNWQEQDFDWLKTVAEIYHKYGIRIILGYSMQFTNQHNQTVHNLSLTCSGLQKTNAEKELDKITILGKLVMFLGLDWHTAKETTADLTAFAAECQRNDSRAGKAIEAMSIEAMHHKYLPHFDIKKFFNISYGAIPSGTIKEADCKVDIATIIDAVQKTPKKVVANYIFYHLLVPFMSTHSKEKAQREKECIRETMTHFPQIGSFMYYRANDLHKSAKDLDSMWHNVKATLQTMLESSQLSWFDNVTRQYALDKLLAMKMLVPLYEENNFDEDYRQLTVSRHDYLENRKSVMAFNAARARAPPAQLTDRALSLYTAKYSFPSNTVIIPVPLVAADFLWSPLYPKSINYAYLGFVMAHEAFHGFSAGGRKYNNLGNWSVAVETEYNERRQCLYDQYHNYTFGDDHLPQDYSQMENAADNGGIVLAYDAYRRWYEDSARTPEELALETFPHLNYTNRQLFFINYAQVWCADTYEGYRSTVAADKHSPAEFRTFVPLTNFPEFAKVFKCPKGSAMNPLKQCSIF